MSNEPNNPGPVTPVDSGSQALAEALRSSFKVVQLVMVVLFAAFLLSGLFTVGPQEKAIVLRLGKAVGEGDKALLGSGWHWAWPYPIDEVIRIPITEIQYVTAKGSWYFVTAEQEALNMEPPGGPTLNPAVDGYALTADGNIVHTKATVSYQIEDPVRCVFSFAADTKGFTLDGVSNAVRNALDNVLVHTAATYKVDDLLLKDAAGFQDAVRRRVAKLVDDQKLGIKVVNCIVQSRPPRQLKQVFDNVLATTTRRDTLAYQARTEASQTLGKADSDAAGRINSAQTARTLMVNSLNTEADRFRKLLPAYESDPQFFVQQRLTEVMGRVFSNAQDKMLLPDSADGKATQLRLLLSRDPQKAKTDGNP